MRFRKRLVGVFVIVAAMMVLGFAAAYKTDNAGLSRYTSDGSQCVLDAVETSDDVPPEYAYLSDGETESQSVSGDEERHGRWLIVALKIIFIVWGATEAGILIAWTALDCKDRKRMRKTAEENEKTSDDEVTSDDGVTLDDADTSETMDTSDET